MTDEQVSLICNANPTNRYICKRLDEKTLNLCKAMLSKLDANEFKEINPDAKFDITWLPIPIESIKNGENLKDAKYSDEVNKEFQTLLKAINHKGTNFEYSYVLIGMQTEEEKYSDAYIMYKGGTQAVNYDWKRIEEFLKKDLRNVNFSIFHTHPKAIGAEHKTLYNEHKEIFEEFGVKPDGLNLSLSDIYANQYLDMLCEKYGKDYNIESTVLMHDGTLISFSTRDGVKLTSEQKLELNTQKNEEQELIL